MRDAGELETTIEVKFYCQMLGKDGTFLFTIRKEKYKDFLTKVGFEVNRILEKTWRKKSREMWAKSFSDGSEKDGVDSTQTQGEEDDDDVTVAVSNYAKDTLNDVSKEEEEFPLLVEVGAESNGEDKYRFENNRKEVK